MGTTLDPCRPADVDELTDAIAEAALAGTRLSITGGGSLRDLGAPTTDARLLDMRGFAGVIDYDAPELVLTVGAATPLAEIEALVAQRGQMLAFEPFDHAPLFGREAGAATIGGVIAAGVAGSQRVSQGAPRDHLLGFEAVSGRGERFVAGAKVVKNVTGYDLPKLAAGSRGRLFAMTQLTLKVLPSPRRTMTKVVEGLGFPAARTAMAAALGSRAEVAAAAHLPAWGDVPARTLVRIQGFGPSVEARGRMLDDLLGQHASVRTAAEDEAAALWQELRLLQRLAGERPLWRINVAPSRALALVDALEGEWLADWGGGLIWLASGAESASIRAAVEQAGGHATLVRAPAGMRGEVPALHPQSAGVAALEERLRRAFDPAGVFETGRFA